MPPVLGPVSPSPTRLWSCADASAMARVPSTSANRLASSPSRNSSITIGPSPAARIAASASSRVIATVTPLPAARPSALITTGIEKPSSAAKASVDGFDPGIIRRWNSRARAKVLGKAFRAFELGGGSAWPEGGNSRSPRRVGDSGDERGFGSDDDEIDRLAPSRDARRLEGRKGQSQRIRPSARCRDCRARRPAFRSLAIA